MNRKTIGITFVLLSLVVLVGFVACNQEDHPEQLKEYVVTFDTQGGSEIAPVTVVEGGKVKQPAAPTREGYYFAGWYKNASYTSEYKFSSAVKSDITIYARWWTTKYYMPAGWSKTVTTPVWNTIDEGTVDTSAVKLVLEGDAKSEVTNVTPELEAALAEALKDPDYFQDVKNIIIIISDGMGITHVQASEQWSGDLIMTKLPNVGASKTKTRENETTDSAAGGTAISAGYKTTMLFASMDAEGNNLKSVSELAREQGKLVGIVTNAELADATPAVFSIHNKNRRYGWTRMCQQQIVFGADLFMGNGASDYDHYFSSTSNPMNKFVKANNIAMYTEAADIVANFGSEEKMWAIFAATANKFARFDSISPNYPNLQQMTAYALSWLDAHDTSDQGFVVMIENTYTDHFGHNNTPSDGSANTFGIVKEVQSTDEAVAIALKYVLEHPDTALIVTADHETGDTQLRVDSKTGEALWKEDFSKIKATSGSHSSQNVPVFAIGKGTEVLNTLDRTEEERAAGARWNEATAYENDWIGQVIGHILGDDSFGGDDVSEDNSSKVSAEMEITVTSAAKTLTYTLDLKGAPIFKNEVEEKDGNTSMVQFKIKPVNANDKVKVDLKSGDSYVPLFAEAEFSTAVDPLAKDEKGKIIPLETDVVGNVTTALSLAFKQAFVTESGLSDGWYQFSIPATATSDQIRITLTAANGGTFAPGAKIGMDDLTIQFGSTIGELAFSSDNATVTGECLWKPKD